jgi:hypothetical protein
MYYYSIGANLCPYINREKSLNVGIFGWKADLLQIAVPGKSF